VRTSGETRLSDFLLWQCRHALLVFTPVLWPDFGFLDLVAAVMQYQRQVAHLQRLRTAAERQAEAAVPLALAAARAAGAAEQQQKQQQQALQPVKLALQAQQAAQQRGSPCSIASPASPSSPSSRSEASAEEAATVLGPDALDPPLPASAAATTAPLRQRRASAAAASGAAP